MRPTEPSTGTMRIGNRSAAPSREGGTQAGLVLLYAPSYADLPPAFAFSDPVITIGRDPTSTIVLDENAVSFTHARVVYEEGAYWIEDLRSRNGTLVDGVRRPRARLEPQTEVRVGDVLFKFVPTGAESYARFRIDGVRFGKNGKPLAERPLPRLAGGYQITSLLRPLRQLAREPISVIVRGESGTGKELAAEYIHQESGRKGPFRAVNCGAIPEQLVEAELFGAKRGAYTGAHQDAPGLFRAAHGGTLFLDEIGDMPLAVQVKLLRVLQTREVTPLGATSPVPVDVRVVCATHRDLGAMQLRGEFRGDLLARLNEYSFDMPPLRDRKEDIFLLCRALLAREGKEHLSLSIELLTGLLHYDYPFNVRELDGFLRTAAALCEGSELGADLMPGVVRKATQKYGEPPADEEASPAIREAELAVLLVEHKGNVKEVARALGRGRTSVYRLMQHYGMVVADFR